MLQKTLFSALLMLILHSYTKAQIDSTTVDSLLTEFIDIHDSTGIYTFKTHALQKGELFTLYKQYFLEDHSNNLILEHHWKNDQSGQDHYRYRQFHKGIAVEGASMQEHTEGIYVLWANGKIAALSDSTDTAGTMKAVEALAEIWADYGYNEEEYYWPWLDSDWEQELKDETNDPTATYWPVDNAELIWALNDRGPFGHVIEADHYTLAWKFKVVCAAPYFSRHYYVNAKTGEVFRDEPTGYRNGPANTYDHGPQTLDTRPNLWYHILKTNDGTHQIHTKELTSFALTAGLSWGLMSNVTDDDDDWGNDHQESTVAHWMVTRAWDYYEDEHGMAGPDGDAKRIRIRSNAPHELEIGGTQYEPNNSNNDYIIFAERPTGDYGLSIDIAGHEYTHGVVIHTSDLAAFGESGALHESFADIFGFLVEAYTEGSISDWLIGEDVTNDETWVRSLANPQSFYRHYTNVSCDEDSTAVGQPDTYEGLHWESGSCDEGGVHINSGPQNFWFYLLVNGGSGINDNNDAYTVQGIGLADAELITFRTMTELTENASYQDARATSLQVALDEWGQCSEQYWECSRAWHAVGVGDVLNCPLLGRQDVEHHASGEVTVFPNPSSGLVHIAFNGPETLDLIIYDATGAIVGNHHLPGGSNPAQIDLKELSNGIYILAFNSSHGVSSYKRLVINHQP